MKITVKNRKKIAVSAWAILLLGTIHQPFSFHGLRSKPGISSHLVVARTTGPIFKRSLWDFDNARIVTEYSGKGCLANGFPLGSCEDSVISPTIVCNGTVSFSISATELLQPSCVSIQCIPEYPLSEYGISIERVWGSVILLTCLPGESVGIGRAMMQANNSPTRPPWTRRAQPHLPETHQCCQECRRDAVGPWPDRCYSEPQPAHLGSWAALGCRTCAQSVVSFTQEKQHVK